MRKAASPLRVLALAPLPLLVVALQALWSVWSAPSFDLLGADDFAALVAEHCPAEAIVVMGAAQYDGQPSPALQRRLAGAERLYQAGCAPLVLVSGGRREGDRFSEGEAGVAYLQLRGLPASALVAETEARTSVENLSLAQALLPAGRWLVVTDDLHSVRTGVAARRLGLDVQVLGVRVRTGRWDYALRETTALIAYRLGAFR